MQSKSPEKYVFVHFWSGSPGIWRHLVPHFPKKQTSFVDLGYYGALSGHEERDEAIYITHSLGTLWTLKHKRPQMKALVVVNGFASFAPFTSHRVLEAMKRRLQSDPHNQMTEFWLNADATETPPTSVLNIERLSEGLDWLAHWNEEEAVKALDVPILVLAGSEDKILPLEKMKAHWQNTPMHIKEEAGHSLPQTHADWCAEKINEFLDAAKP